MNIQSSDKVLILKDTLGLYKTIEQSITSANVNCIESDTNPQTILSSYYNHIISAKPQIITYFGEFLRALKPGGKLHIFEGASQKDFEETANIKTNLTINGFVDINISEHLGLIMTTSSKPSWNLGSTQPLRKKANAWSSLNNNSNVELIDEESLLDESDLTKPKKIDDCEFGTTKKACKNCSCGRSEDGTDSPKLTLEMLENPGVDSSCGSCSLGDAFRCAGCPYKGLPSFEVGQKIVLDDDFDMSALISN